MSERRIGLILAAHGERGGTGNNGSLIGHAEAMASAPGIAAVAAGVLKGDPTLEDALASVAAEGATDILVYPFFMSDGYFVEKVLPQRIRDAGHERKARILPPLGLDPGLPALMLETALKSAGEAGYDPAACRLLVVGHGSQGSRASALATELMALKLANKGIFSDVTAAFLEEAPFVRESLEGERPPTVVAGFFSGDGLHAAQDVPEAIAWSGAQAVYAGSIGGHIGIAGLIAAAVERALASTC